MENFDEETINILIDECGKDEKKWLESLSEGETFIKFMVEEINGEKYSVKIALDIKDVEIIEEDKDFDLMEFSGEYDDADFTLQ